MIIYCTLRIQKNTKQNPYDYMDSMINIYEQGV